MFRQAKGLVGILTAPFVHLGWVEFLINAAGILIFGTLLLMRGTIQFFFVTGYLMLATGASVWLFAKSGVGLTGKSTLLLFLFLNFSISQGSVESSMDGLAS